MTVEPINIQLIMRLIHRAKGGMSLIVIPLLALLWIGLQPADSLVLGAIATGFEGVGPTLPNRQRDEVKIVELGESRVRLVDGSEIVATITSIAADGSIEGENVPAGLNLRNVLSLKTFREIKRDESNSVSIFVVSGGQVFSSDPVMADEKISFHSTSGTTELSLQAVTAIVWSTSPMVERLRNTPSREYDTVVVKTADGERPVEGVLDSIDSQFVHLDYKGEVRKIGLAKVKSVIMADLGLDKPTGALASVQLIDKSNLVGVIVGATAGQLRLNVATGTSLSLNTSTIGGIKIDSDRLLYLSDVEPVEVQEKAIFAIQRPWRRDRSVENNELSIRLADSEETVQFNKGLGTQASSRMVFANTKQFDRFGAVAGIDAETGGRGDCQMVVRGDGIELWSQRIRGTDGPQEIDVDITGMKEIALLVYPGEGFDLGDHADWGDARFLKTK